jgi:DNA-binding GntR family transcriptional regulator
MNKFLKKETLVEQITLMIREYIISGEFPPGSKISLRQLAQKLGVSRTPLREAARRIESEGLAIYVPRKGFIINFLNIDNVEEIYSIREILESFACKLACQNITKKEIEKIEKIKNKIEKIKLNFSLNKKRDIKLLHKLNRDFHFSIYKASKNKLLVDMISNLWDKSSCIIYYVLNSPKRINNLISEHENIYNSLIDRDEIKIEKALKNHLSISKNLVIKCIKEKDCLK